MRHLERLKGQNLQAINKMSEQIKVSEQQHSRVSKIQIEVKEIIKPTSRKNIDSYLSTDADGSDISADADGSDISN